MVPSAAERSRVTLALLALFGSGCVVSFEGYELGAGSGGTTAGSTATGGTVAGGSGGTATAGSGGSVSGGTGGETDAGGATGGTSPGGTGGTGGSIVTGGTGGAGGTGGTGGTGGGFSCPSVAGATVMVQITDGSAPYCIDSTEVTMKQYAAFLGITNKPAQQSVCTSNADYTPSSCGAVAFNPGLDKPVVCVDWCDAYAYCKAIGKRLCGKIGSGSLTPPADATNAAVSQWFRACSAAGTQDYPYGPAFAPKTCNGAESDWSGLQTVPVVSCVSSAYSLLYDLSGNAAEWEDDCNASGCAVRGGHHLSPGVDLKCAAAPLFARTSVAEERGFRCCAD